MLKRLDLAEPYLLSDHLGSTSITADASGNREAELRYLAFGDTRYT